MKRLFLVAALVFAALPVRAEIVHERNASYSLDGNATQGGLLVGRAAPGSAVTLDGAAVQVASDGAFLVAFPYNYAKRAAALTVRAPGRTAETREIAVTARKFDVQRIDGLPERTVEPLPEDVKKIQEEQRLIREARAPRRDGDDFLGGFVWPAEGIITGVYGSQRILNGQPRAPHLGVDIAAPRGTPIRAAAAGRVALAEKGFFLNGSTVILDHGLGLTSVYIHLDDIAVAPGQMVAKGARIGSMGRSGRATGVNLHWGVTLGDVGLDPQLLVGPMPKPMPQPAN